MGEEVSRREFLGASLAAGVSLAVGGIAGCSAAEKKDQPNIVPASQPKEPKPMDFTQLRGFNYQFSYGMNMFDQFRFFRDTPPTYKMTGEEVVRRDLSRGKKNFPKLQALRTLLSFEAYTKYHQYFTDILESYLKIADENGLTVMPILFNRWHQHGCDLGDIYIDFFLPGAWSYAENWYKQYVQDVVGKFAKDPRICAWDLCNEPFMYDQSKLPDVAKAEFAWLKGTYDLCKQVGATQPLTIGIQCGQGEAGVRQIEPISDIISFHPYWDPRKDKEFGKYLDMYVSVAAQAKKPLVASEVCIGSYNDAERAEIVRGSLTQLKQRKIGWTPYALYCGGGTFMSFMKDDGSIRPGHEVYNEF